MTKVRLGRGCAVVFFVLVAASLLSVAMPRVVAHIERPTIYSCNNSGLAKDTFGPGETVFVRGEKYGPNEWVTIYVQPDGKAYLAGSSVQSKHVQADASGKLGIVSLDTLAMGGYDMWVDRGAGDGWLQYQTEPSSGFGCGVGLLVVPEFWMGTILGLVGCFAGFGAFRLYRLKRK